MAFITRKLKNCTQKRDLAQIGEIQTNVIASENSSELNPNDKMSSNLGSSSVKMEIPNNVEENRIIRSLPTGFDEFTNYMNSKFFEISQLLNRMMDQIRNEIISLKIEILMNKLYGIDTSSQDQRKLIFDCVEKFKKLWMINARYRKISN
jgi:hypothetical protein